MHSDEDDEYEMISSTQNFNASQDDEDGTSDANDEGVWGSLVHTERSMAEGTFELKDDQYTLGRGKVCQFRLKDFSISSKHCMVYREGKTIFIKDLGSSNGTYLNGEKLEKNKGREIYHEDLVSFVRGENPIGKENTKNGDDSDGKKKKPILGRWFELTFESANPEQYGTRAATSASHGSSSSSSNNNQLSINSDMCSDRPICENLEKKYEIFEVLGKGTYATVYRVVDKTTKKEHAVKIIMKRQFMLNDPKRWQDQINEATILKRLRHPGIIDLVDMFVTEDALFIVMELVRGGELFDRLVDGGAYSERRAKLLVRNLLDAVAYLHEQNIIHRDLKPENILLVSREDDVSIKLVDFGIAKEERGGRATVCGSVNYIAPEVLKRQDTIMGVGKYGKGADMWSLGVVVYIILTLCPPFEENDTRPMEKRVQAVFESPQYKELPPLTKQFVSGLLQIDEDKRLTANQALNHPWLKNDSEINQQETKMEIDSTILINNNNNNNDDGPQRSNSLLSESDSQTINKGKASLPPPPPKFHEMLPPPLPQQTPTNIQKKKIEIHQPQQHENVTPSKKQKL